MRKGIGGPSLSCRNDTFDDFLMTVRESAYRNACIGVFSVNTDASCIASFLLIEDEYVSHGVTIRRNTHLAVAQVSSASYYVSLLLRRSKDVQTYVADHLSQSRRKLAFP